MRSSCSQRYMLFFAVIVSLLLPCTGLAYQFAGGTGEPNDPFQIATSEQLIQIGWNQVLLGKHFILTEDIVLDPNQQHGNSIISSYPITRENFLGFSAFSILSKIGKILLLETI